MSGVKRLLLITCTMAAGATLLAAPVIVKLSTIAPPGTTWDTALAQMGADWRKATDGRVVLKVTNGQGGESKIIRLMSMGTNTVDAAALTSAGLSEIDPAFNVFGIPFMFQSDEEEQFVRGKLEPVLARRLEAKHYKLLSWGFGGWVQLFSTVPINSLADLKSAKLFTGAGNDKMQSWYDSNGFRAIPLDSTAIPQAMTTGAINAAPLPPFGVVALQLSRTVKYMLEINVDPLVGALVMWDSTWNKIDAADRDKVIAAAKVMEKKLQVDIPAQDAKAVTDMQKLGLKVTKLDLSAAAAFRAEAGRLVTSMKGSMVPADVFDLAMQARDEFRRTHAR